jgi:imidazolonepropionase-like amidohydrolase
MLAGLVDAHAHPAIAAGKPGILARDPAQTVAALAEWAAEGVGLVRDVGSPGGLTLRLKLGPEARRRVAGQRDRLTDLLPLAHRLGVPILAGTDTAGTLAGEIALLAQHGLEPAQALAAATTTAHRYLGVDTDTTGQPATLVTYDHDPREDLTRLADPRAVIINGTRIR